MVSVLLVIGSVTLLSFSAVDYASRFQAARAYASAKGVMFGFDAAHTNFNPYEEVLNSTNVSRLVLDWTVSSTSSAISSSPTVAKGLVYIGSDDGKLYAFDAATGKNRWASTSTGTAWRSYDGYDVGGLFPSAAVAGGLAYVESWDGKLYAFDAATGQTRWTSVLEKGNIPSCPVVMNGLVYASTTWDNSDNIGNPDSRLYVFDAASGQSRWTSAPAGGMYTTPSYTPPAVADGLAYVGSAEGKLYAFDAATGQLHWSSPAGNSIRSSPAVANGLVYVSSRGHKLYALNATTGQTLWTSAPLKAALVSTPTVANGVVYIGSVDGKLYAFHLPSTTS